MGMVGCIICLCFLSAHIWKIEFYGNSYYTDEGLKKYLAEAEGIDIGIWKHQISNSMLEENLRLTFPDISWVSVRKEGISLIVNLEEMVKYNAGDKEAVKPRYICSSKDGEIVSMVTRSGVPRMRVGMAVEKGDILIDGVMEILDDSMMISESLPVGADGDIWAKVTEVYQKIYPLKEESRNYGRASWKIHLSAGNFSMILGKNPYKDSEEEKYDCLSEITAFWPGIQIQTEAFRPYVIVPSFRTVSDVKMRAEEELSDIIREFEEKGVQILENNVKILMYEDRVEAIGNFVLIEPVGEGCETLPEDIQNDEIGEADEYNRDND